MPVRPNHDLTRAIGAVMLSFLAAASLARSALADALPADNLSLTDRGRLKPGAFADLVVFDPNTLQDHATYEKPHQLSTGVSYVVVNGIFAIKDGVPTGAHSGRIVRGRGWTGAGPGGGCRASAKDWIWSK